MRKNPNFWLVLLVAVSLIPLRPFLKPGVFFGHDIVPHIIRAASFYDSLKEGHLVPRWSGDLNAGFGHPIFMFVYPLPSYLASVFHSLGFSIISSIKFIFGTSFVFSGIFFFLWLKELFGKKAALVGSVFYLFSPYRFMDMYIRTALGECLAFMFVPLVFYFLERISKKREYKFFLGGSLSLVGLILSHNALSLMFMPLVFLYALFLIWRAEQRRLTASRLLFTIFLGFSLSAFFWAPSLYEGKYTLRDIVISPGEILSHFPQVKELFLPPLKVLGVEKRSNNLSFYLGFPQVLVHFLAPFLILNLKRKKGPLGLFFLFSFLLSLLAVFMLLETSKPIWRTITMLQKFQFTWRFLALTTFLPAVLGAGLAFTLKRNFLTWLLILITMLSTYPFWRPTGYLLQNEQDLIKDYIGTTDTGECGPRWSTRGKEERAEAPIEVVDGEAEIKTLERISTKHVFEAEVEKRTRLVDNTLYFPGWQVLIDGEKTEIEFQDQNYRGLMTFWIEPGRHEIRVVFGETRFRLASDLVSLFGLGILGLGGIMAKIKNQKPKIKNA